MAPHQEKLVLSWLLFLVAWIQPCYSSALYAYSTDRTTQVGIQDPSTGQIFYSNCNSEDTPIFPLDKPNVLETDNKPRNGTSLAAVGWWDTQKIIASIFWQSEDNVIVNGYYECDMETGKLKHVGEYTISLTAEVNSIHSESGIAVDLLGGGEDGGYRVFYHNEDRQIKMMSYTDDTTWIDAGTVSQDTADGTAIGTVFYDKKNITVAFPKGEDNIETSRLQKTGNWTLTSFPQQLAGNYTNNTASAKIRMSSETPEFSLPGWNASIEAIGMATDQSRTRSLFYLGDDKVLREAIAIWGKDDWQITPNRSEEIWPLADDPSAGLAVAYNQGQGMTWIYYWSNDTIVQAYKNHDGEWEKAIALPQTVPKNETKSDEPSKESEPVPEDTDLPTGMTTGAKAGVGVGVAAGVISLGVLIWFFMKKRRNNQTPPQKEDVAVAEAGGTPVTIPAPMYEKDTYKTGDATTPAEMSGDGRPVEMDSHTSFVYELPGNDRK